MTDDRDARWYPVAAEGDLPLRHTFAGQLLGRELAIWRADDGHVNVWEDRCLHRGVRLSIGLNDGAELMCQYHGWRYANRTGACTYIPAHPADAPAQTICTRGYAAVARYGLVWSTISSVDEVPVVDSLDASNPVALRALPVNASAEQTLGALRGHSFLPSGELCSASAPEVSVQDLADLAVEVTSRVRSATDVVVFFVQPVDAGRSIIRPVLAAASATLPAIDLLRHHINTLDDLRTDIEAAAALQPAPDPIAVEFEPIPELSEQPADARSASNRVVVAKKFETAEGVMAFDLEPVGAELPGFQAGAHIDVHLPNGLVRQYSLINGPGDSAAYCIGVKLEPESRGGSSCLHESVREGDVLAVSDPHNNFTLRRDALQTVLIAGGIGVTPLLSMAKTLARGGLEFALHYYAQSEAHVSFAADLEALGPSVVTHLGLTPEATQTSLSELLETVREHTHVYICGPGPMLDAARGLARGAGWPHDAIHFEYFKNTNEIEYSSDFEISLARSALTLRVGEGETILEVLRANGIEMASSCEQGACGTCMLTVLEGEPEHQDVYLSDSERAEGDKIMTCVSRAASERLILDI